MRSPLRRSATPTDRHSFSNVRSEFGDRAYLEVVGIASTKPRVAGPDVAGRTGQPEAIVQVLDLINRLKAEDIGILLISHAIHDVFDARRGFPYPLPTVVL